MYIFNVRYYASPLTSLSPDPPLHAPPPPPNIYSSPPHRVVPIFTPPRKSLSTYVPCLYAP